MGNNIRRRGKCSIYKCRYRRDKSRYSVDVRYKADENNDEGTCFVRIYTYVFEKEVDTTFEFTYKIDVSKAPVKGDVNSDGVFNASDVVLVQKWLAKLPNIQLENWKAADMNEDEKLNVCDLCITKREWVKS